jgi:hypothetical protein
LRVPSVTNGERRFPEAKTDSSRVFTPRENGNVCPGEIVLMRSGGAKIEKKMIFQKKGGA